MKLVINSCYGGFHLSPIIIKVRAEAYKEFARKLKCGVPQETGVIRCADIDNLLKKMVGDNK